MLQREQKTPVHLPQVRREASVERGQEPRTQVHHNAEQTPPRGPNVNDTSAMFQQHSADVPRDRYGRYLLPDESGDQIGWTRATTFAATLAEAHGLRIWEQRQVVWGLGRRPDLVTLASTIAGPEDKKALGEIVDSAHEAAGTQAKANRGTAVHKAIQVVEQAADWSAAIAATPDELRPDVLGYFHAMASAQGGPLQTLPNLVERVVIVPQYRVAGTPDNYVLCPDGKIRVLDKKTGNLDYASIEFAVQLALYANAKALRNYGTNTYEPLPEVATDYAIIAHVVPGTGRTELMRVNIAWGWAWARTCAEVMDIRKTKNVITPYNGPSTLTSESVISQPSTAQVVAVNASGPVLAVESGSPFASSATNPAVPIQTPSSPAGGASLSEITPNTKPGRGSAYETSALAALRTMNDLIYVATRAETPAECVTSAFEIVRRDRELGWRISAEDLQYVDTAWASRGLPPLHSVVADLPPVTKAGSSWDPIGDTSALFYGEIEDEDQTGWQAEDPSQGVPVAAAPAPPAPAPAASPDAAPAEAVSAATTPAAGVAEGDAVPLVIDDPEAAAQALVDGAKGKAKLQQAAKELAAQISERSGKPFEFKLNQHQIKLARQMVEACNGTGYDLPAFAPSSRSKPDAVQTDEEKRLTTQLDQIRRMPTIEGLTQYQAQLGERWTDEHQQAARVRAEEINAAASQQQTGLTVEQIIDGATSTQTLTIAWRKATNNNTNPDGWTPALEQRAAAKAAELTAQNTGQVPPHQA